MVGERWDGWSEQAAPGAPPAEGEGRWAQGGQPGQGVHGQGPYGPGAHGEGPYGQGGGSGWTQPGQPAQPAWDRSGQGAHGQGPYGPGAPGPWGQPGYPPAPPRRRGPHPAVLVGIALALFLVVGVVAAVVLSAGSDDDGSSASGSGGSEGAGTLEPASDVELVPYDHPDGSYSVSTPAGWVTTPVEGDLAGLGAEMFPDDPTLAESFDQGTQTMPRSIVFVSMDREDMEARRFTTNLTVARVSGVPVGDLDDLETVLRREIETFGNSEVTEESRVETPAGEAIRMEYDLGMPGVSGIQFGLLIDGDVWSFAYTSDDLPDDEGVADAIAATFDVP